MSALETLEEKAVISRKLAILLKELDEECAHVQDLIAQLKLSNLTSEQVENILAELHAAIVHLNTHTSGLDELVSQEMDGL
jgi:DNA repair exonuclease SbcCD ATPase subunit